MLWGRFLVEVVVVASIQFKLRSLLVAVLFIAMFLAIVLLTVDNVRERRRSMALLQLAEAERMRAEAHSRQASASEQQARAVAAELSRQLEETKVPK
jgi:hypothetical protein